ncbi:hypothetical protein HDF16_005032 [Granulicella aggregans]|uniref:Uncharacterized protein n=1 Tax=Granulicella aggregans TaxID=474949 RepID=A0A7W7ZJF6_9BACT|nr:hypothetical protein [Granulicella aggregans]MBB5060296.1 hypothetical protein [Granulicella aggregans]
MKRKGGELGLGFARSLSLRISEALATTLEKQRVKISSEVGTSVSASDVVRRAVETYLVEAGHKVSITPWPSAPTLEEKVKQLEAEIERLRKMVPGEAARELETKHFFH